MQKTMVFIDYQNFNINMKKYVKSSKLELFNINFIKLSNEVTKHISLDAELIKTFLFAHKPCDELLKLPYYKNHYNWLLSLNNTPYLEIVEGRQEIRSKTRGKNININDPSTFKTEEKGTDINLAINMLSKSYQNSLDVAVLVSGDTDYIPVAHALHQIGKIVVLASLPNQNIDKYKGVYDEHIKIDMNMLNNVKTK